MQRILLQGKNLTEIREIRDYLEKKLPYQVEISMSEKDTVSQLIAKQFHLFVNSALSFKMEDTLWLKDLRLEGYEQPILILGEKIDRQAMSASVRADRVHFAEKPIELFNLKGLVKKLVKQRQIPQQQFKRFRTNQSMDVENYSTGESVETSLFNLSVGGAYFESQGKYQAGIGDLLKMSVQLNDLRRSHMMNAKVVWTTRKGTYSGGYGVGVRFVKNDEVFNHLMAGE